MTRGVRVKLSSTYYKTWNNRGCMSDNDQKVQKQIL